MRHLGKKKRFESTLLQTISPIHSPHPSSLFANTIWLLGEKVTRLIVGLALGILLARFLGPEKYGVLSYALSFVALFSILGTLGLDSFLVRELVHRPHDRCVLLASALVLCLGGALLIVIFASVSSLLFGPTDKEFRWLVLVASLGTFFQSLSIVELWFQSGLQARYAVIIRVATFLTSVSLRALLAINNAPIMAFIVVSTVELTVTSLALVITYQRLWGDLRLWHPKLTEMRSLIAQGMPVLLSGIAVAAYARIDMVMLGHMTNVSEVGWYNAATTISEAYYMLPIAVMVSYAPRLIAQKISSEETFHANLQKILNIISAAGLTIAMFTTIVASDLIEALFGVAYLPATPMLIVHIWSTLFVFLSVASEPWFINHGIQKLYIAKTYLAAIANIVINWALIPYYGGVGAAIATLVAYSLSAYWTNLLFPQTRQLFHYQTQALMLGFLWHRR